MVNSPIRFMALSSSVCTGSPLRSLSEASIPPIAFSRHCSSRKISTPNWRDRSSTGSPRAMTSGQNAERPPAKRRGPKPAISDQALLVAIEADLETSPWEGEGYRKVWARLRVCRDIRVARKRVLRLMRENNLLSPHRCRRRGGNPHDGEIITHAPNLMWGTDGVRVFTVDDGWGWIVEDSMGWIVIHFSKWCRNNTGQFVYYGDNKRPGHTLHETARGGNALLRLVFERIHSQPAERNKVPPCFVFRKYATPVSARSFQFRGLEAPGFPVMPPTYDLVAVWKTAEGQRFQNYRATFTVLNEAEISQAWIDDLMNGEILTENYPVTWSDWVERNHYNTLTSERTTDIRSLATQTPEGSNKQNILRKVWERFKDRPTDFERFAACIFQMHDNRVIIDEITRSLNRRGP